jgi:nucleotide-binding universal stress UspA family protein
MPQTHEAERVKIDGGVLVGDDGSAVSRAAVVWAAQDAARRGTTLHVLRAWSMTTAPRPTSWTPGYIPALPEWQAAVMAELGRRCTDLLADLKGTAFEMHAVHAPAARALIDTSQGADLVVVGTRGRGGFAGLVLGSVAEQVVRHAYCPVTVVRTQRHRGPSA